MTKRKERQNESIDMVEKANRDVECESTTLTYREAEILMRPTRLKIVSLRFWIGLTDASQVIHGLENKNKFLQNKNITILRTF